MRKAVLISIRPAWCQKIANGEKTIEVRKNRPKLAPPFKCYIYCTQAKYPHEDFIETEYQKPQFYGGGKIIGEFTCKGFIPFSHGRPCFVTGTPEEIARMACLTRKEIWEYAPQGNPIGWRITDLVIYDAPHELNSFRRVCPEDLDCESCAMLKEQVWRDLDAFLTATFSKKDGTQLPILCTCIDSGGHHTDQVYRFTKERYERRIFAIKGKGGQEVPYIRNPSTNNRVKTPLFVLGVDAGKALVYQRLKHEPPERKGPNYCHFPLNEEAGYDEQYFRGLTSEKAVVRFRKGRSVTVWEIKDASYKRNEPLDLRNYATAALEIANPVLKGPEEPEIERRQRATGRRRLSGGI